MKFEPHRIYEWMFSRSIEFFTFDEEKLRAKAGRLVVVVSAGSGMNGWYGWHGMESLTSLYNYTRCSC